MCRQRGRSVADQDARRHERVEQLLHGVPIQSAGGRECSEPREQDVLGHAVACNAERRSDQALRVVDLEVLADLGRPELDGPRRRAEAGHLGVPPHHRSPVLPHTGEKCAANLAFRRELGDGGLRTLPNLPKADVGRMSADAITRRSSRIDAYAAALLGAVVVAMAGAAGTIAWTPQTVTVGTALVTVILMVLASLTDRLGELVGDAVTVGLEIVPFVAAVAVGGAWSAFAVAAAMTIGNQFQYERNSARFALNLATLVASAAAASAALTVVMRAEPLGSTTWVAAGAAAGFAFHLVNAATLAPAASVDAELPLLATFRAGFVWMTPHALLLGVIGAGMGEAWHELGLAGLLVFGAPGLGMLLAIRHVVRQMRREVETAEATSKELRGLLDRNQDLLARIGTQHLAMIRGLAQAVDAKDPYTAGHTERVAEYAVAIGAALGLAPDELQEIEHGALLHDIGKIGVPDDVLHKPGALASDEWEAMRRHPEIACAILESMDLSPNVLAVVRNHHENLDGTGYPDGLTAAEIPTAALIARVVDAFDAMTSTRPYRSALPVEAALAELRRCSGTQFSPEIVTVLEQLIRQGRIEISDDASGAMVAD